MFLNWCSWKGFVVFLELLGLGLSEMAQKGFLSELLIVIILILRVTITVTMQEIFLLQS